MQEGTWIAVDCTRDDMGMAFWLAQAKHEMYAAEAEFSDGNIEIKAGDLVVDVQYYQRVSPDNALEFYVEESATIHIGSIIRVSDLGVEAVQQQVGNKGKKGKGKGKKGRGARGMPNVQLQRASSIRIMDAWKERHPTRASAVL